MLRRRPATTAPCSVDAAAVGPVLHVLSVAFAVLAALSMACVLAAMLTGRPRIATGLVLRAVALICFVAAVALNVAAG